MAKMLIGVGHKNYTPFTLVPNLLLGLAQSELLVLSSKVLYSISYEAIFPLHSPLEALLQALTASEATWVAA